MVVRQNPREAMHWSRGENRLWSREIVEGIDSAAALPSIGLTLTLSELYDGVEFPPGPRVLRLRDPE
jgi:hypothetical protein